MKHCNNKTCILSALLLFIFFWAYEFWVNAVLLKGLYMQTAGMWRPHADMMALMPWSLLRYLVMALALTCLFKKFRKGMAACKSECPTTGAAASEEVKTTNCPIKSGGCKFGLKIGLLLGVWSAGAYVYIPIPGALALAWFFSGLFEGIGAGVILGMVCKGKSGTCTMK